MPLRYEDLQPGDLILCYDWNGVAKAQAAVKGIARVGAVLTFPISGPIHLVNAARNRGVTWGAADCNHALVMGVPEVVDGTNRETVTVASNVDPGTQPRLENRADEVWAIYRDREGTQQECNLTPHLAAFGVRRPTEMRVFRGKLLAAMEKRVKLQHPRVCHSTGGGCTWHPAEFYFGNHSGRMVAWRLRDPAVRGSIGARAARIATTWAEEANPGIPSKYSVRKALFSIFGTSAYGSSAQERVRKYRLHRDTPGGPPSDMKWGLSGNKTGKKEWFCSMFAVACFQGATDTDDEVRSILPVDARHTTPMMLDGLVSKSRQWERIGEVPDT